MVNNNYKEFDSLYDIDIAILSAVTSGGGGGGGVTSGQVETMIDSALTDYSTTSEVEAMIQASGSTGGGDYVSVHSLSEVTSPTEGLVANVIDYTSGGTTHLGTGEWIYRDGAWRAKHVWLDRLSTAELAAMWAYFHGDDLNGNNPNSAKTCDATWFYNKSEWPYLVQGASLTTHSGSDDITFTSIVSLGNAGDSYLDIVYASVDSAGTLSKGYYQVPKGDEKIWEDFEITADGTVVSGNGYWLMRPLDDWSYDYAYRHRNIKCTASGVTYYGALTCGTQDDTNNDRTMTGVITIGKDTYVGVWDVDSNWVPSKHSFTKIEAGGGGGGGKTPLYLPWNRQATSAETQVVIDLMAEARQIYESSGNIYTLLEKYDFLTSDDDMPDRTGIGSPSLRYDYDGGNSPSLYMFFLRTTNKYNENGLGAFGFNLKENGDRNDFYWDISGSISRCVWSQNQQVQTIQYCTQAEYDAEGQQYGHDASRLYLIVPQSNN